MDYRVDEQGNCIYATKRGRDCRLCLQQPGRCPTHSVDLSERNARVARSARGRNPDEYRRQKVVAGKRGFKVTCERYGYDIAMQRLQQGSAEYREENPSSNEVLVEVLLDALQAGYKREVFAFPFHPLHTLDFEVSRVNGTGLSKPLGIFVNGYQRKGGFGEGPCEAAQDILVQDLVTSGWRVLKLDVSEQSSWGSLIKEAVEDLV